MSYVIPVPTQLRPPYGFVASIPTKHRHLVHYIEVGAPYDVKRSTESFLVVIPFKAPSPSEWNVYIEDGILVVELPRRRDDRGTCVNAISGNARGNIQVGAIGGNVYANGVPMVPPFRIGLVVPPDIHVSSVYRG